MGKQDLLLKSYLEDSRRYADLWNGSLFQGRQLVKAEELEEINPVLYKSDGGVLLERTRDLVMKQNRTGQRFAVLAVENQKPIDYGMPTRVMLEEAMAYNRQIKAIVKKNEKADKEYREGKGSQVYRDAGERLYRIRASDRIFPVLTLIVYWGDEQWQGAKSLHDLIDFGSGDMPTEPELKKLVPEYPLHFLDLSSFSHFEYFRTELRTLFELYKKRNDKKEFVEYFEKNKNCWNMDDETWNVFGQLTHSRHIKNLMKNKKNQKNGGKDMCKAIDDWVNDAKAEGMALGKTKGIALGRAEAIIELLEEYGEVPDALKKQLFGQNDIHILKKWLKLSARANSTEEFVRWMHMS